jgi:hypothetical protein
VHSAVDGEGVSAGPLEGDGLGLDVHQRNHACGRGRKRKGRRGAEESADLFASSKKDLAPRVEVASHVEVTRVKGDGVVMQRDLQLLQPKRQDGGEQLMSGQRTGICGTVAQDCGFGDTNAHKRGRHEGTRWRQDYVAVYAVRASRVSRVLSCCSSLHSMNTFHTQIHQRYVM